MEVNAGKFVPGVPSKPISPGNQLSRHGSSVSELSEASSTAQYESYWRVHEKELKLQQAEEKEQNRSPAATEGQLSPPCPPAAVEGPPVEPSHSKVASSKLGEGGGDGKGLGDAVKTSPEVSDASKVNKFDKYYHQILDCFGHQNSQHKLIGDLSLSIRSMFLKVKFCGS